MDSGNSGSIQSSSGGDEEYDSRSESISAFLNQSDHISHPPQQQPPPHHHHHLHNPNSTVFDPVLSNYFDQNPVPNFDTVWSSKTPNCTYGGSLPSGGSLFTASSPPTVPPFPPVAETTARKSDQLHQTGVQAVRNPKKRSRASRRAPTTVLTTDTANFRAMVQEFTGIPAQPFTASSLPFPRSRLDLFGAPSSTRSFPLGDSALQPPPYLLRPFPQKLQPPPPPPSLFGSNNSNPVNFQMQNQILTFQSLLQSPPPNSSSFLRSSGHDQSSEIRSSTGNDDRNHPTVWAGGGAANGGDHDDDQNHLIRTVNGGGGDYHVAYSQSSTASGNIGKLNYEKGPGNNIVAAAARSTGHDQGMVESWICSSDH